MKSRSMSGMSEILAFGKSGISREISFLVAGSVSLNLVCVFLEWNHDTGQPLVTTVWKWRIHCVSPSFTAFFVCFTCSIFRATAQKDRSPSYFSPFHTVKVRVRRFWFPNWRKMHVQEGWRWPPKSGSLCPVVVIRHSPKHNTQGRVERLLGTAQM